MNFSFDISQDHMTEEPFFGNLFECSKDLVISFSHSLLRISLPNLGCIYLFQIHRQGT